MAEVDTHNLFEAPPSSPSHEQFTMLIETPHLRVERILSAGQCSPEGHWYDQEDPEWVILLQGSATLECDAGRRLELRKGDYLLIPPHVKHRVERTSADAVWLAIHYKTDID